MKRVCLLLVDVQKDFWSALPQVQQTFPDFPFKITGLLDSCRAKLNIPVVHVRAVYNDSVSEWIPQWKERRKLSIYGPIVETPEEFANHLSHEKVFIKHTFDAFLGTDLESHLRDSEITHVLVAGLVTGCCVYTTATSAFMRGFHTTVIRDCCADRTVSKHDLTFDTFGLWHFENINLEQLPEYVTKLQQ